MVILQQSIISRKIILLNNYGVQSHCNSVQSIANTSNYSHINTKYTSRKPYITPDKKTMEQI